MTGHIESEGGFMNCVRFACAVAVALGITGSAMAVPFFFSTGNVDGRMAMADRIGSPGKLDIEAADDFILTDRTAINHATFTGLLTGGANVGNIVDVNI